KSDAEDARGRVADPHRGRQRGAEEADIEENAGDAGIRSHREIGVVSGGNSLDVLLMETEPDAEHRVLDPDLCRFRPSAVPPRRPLAEPAIGIVQLQDVADDDLL